MLSKQYKSLSFRTSDAESIKTASIGDQEHLVVPVVALVEGVLFPSNAEAPELALASEFGRHVDGWNGRPIILGHPKDDEGNPISANLPALWGDSVIGMMFNSTVSNKKLKAEMWINKAKAGDELIERFNNETVEVSTGLFADTEESTGFFNGEKYSGIWRNITPDHLAILEAGSIGACSVEDGCGAPRINAQRKKPMPKPNPKPKPYTSSLKASCECQDPENVKASRKGFLQKAAEGFVKLFASIKVGELSDNDVRSALEAALLIEDADAYFYILAVYDANFVYAYYQAGRGMVVLRRDFSIDDSGTINLSQETTEVRPETSYVPVSISVQENPNQSGEIEMTTQKQPTETTPASTEVPAANNQLAAVAATVDPATAEAVAYFNSRKSDLIKGLAGKTDFTEVELTALSMSVLEKMSKLAAPKEAPAPVTNAATTTATNEPVVPANGAAVQTTVKDSEQNYTPLPISIFRKKA